MPVSNHFSLYCRDLQTQTFIASYKDNVSGRNSTAVIGRDFLAAAQSGKSGALHVWSWQKVDMHLLSPPMLTLSSLLPHHICCKLIVSVHNVDEGQAVQAVHSAMHGNLEV